MRNTQLHNDTGIPYINTWIIEQFKKFHTKLKTTESALHFKIGKITKNRRLKPRLPQDILLPPESSSSSSSSEAVKRLEIVQRPIGDIVNAKVKNVLLKKSGLAKMKTIKSILIGISSEASLDVELSPSDIVNIQYCPITSVEVERSFSRYKSILRHNGQSFEFENLKMHVIINCNQDN
ncbi:hypothetical protein QTP88_013584 [Uroleucon formosanum]